MRTRFSAAFRRIAFPVGAVVLAGAGPAWGAVETATATCPVDGSEVKIRILLSSNSLLGHDRDLCPHASGDGDEVRAAVAGCGACGFAGTPAEFRNGVSDAVAERIKTDLKGAPEAPAWELYAARARILEWSEAPAPKVGESWLRAAWSVRLDERPVTDSAMSKAASRIAKAVGLGARPSGSGKKDPILDPARALDAALEDSAGLLARDRAAAWYLAGSLYRQRGELEDAETRYAKALEAAKGSPLAKPIGAAVARDRASIELEESYLERALGWFRSALAAGESVPEAQRTLLAFLAAECARRTGAYDEAERWYRIAERLSETSKTPAAPGPGGSVERDRARVKELVRLGLRDVEAARRRLEAVKKKER